jgi:iron complex outermembrane recepter protein
MAHSSIFKLNLISIAVMSATLSQQVKAADANENIMMSPVVVTATRNAQNSFDLPVAIDVVEQKDIRDGQLQMTLSESLIRVPGITAQNRTNQSQDPQISSRGFGSRSSFGVRGIRVYVDGIPLTMPDGQGQPGVVDLSIIKSIEVMRGPFSALYGNSSGGVIQMLTQDAPDTPEVGATTMFGSYNTKRQIMYATGKAENVEYLLNISNFETDGYRDRSAGDKQAATAKFKVNLSDDTKLTVLANWFDQKAQDPGGLPRVAVIGLAAAPSAFGDRKGVANAVINANTRVERSHSQVGFNLEHQLNQNNSLSFMTYVGVRDNNQVLAVNPQGTNARESIISREFYGSDLRWDNTGEVFDKPYLISFGLNYGKSSDARLDRNVLAGGMPTNTLNRDEDNVVDNFDQYIQGKLAILDNVDLHAGVRRTNVELKIRDKFTTPAGNGDNSGSVEYKKTTPVIGTVWKVTPVFNIYANYGRGFETPSFLEAGFATVAPGSGPNLSLKPSESENYEIGAKAFITDNTQANLTFYKVTTDDEIVTENNNQGRTTFTNANKTKRDGVELSLDSRFDNGLSLFGSYTLLRAKFDSAYTNTLNRTIDAGNRIPGTYRSQIYGEVAWRYEPFGLNTAFEARHNSKVYVDDVNSDIAPSYTIFNIRAGFQQRVANWQFSEYLRVENIGDKDYIGSVRINDNNSRFFEPAAGRNYLLGLSASYRFN